MSLKQNLNTFSKALALKLQEKVKAKDSAVAISVQKTLSPQKKTQL